jgi:hypothetical protein
MLQSQNPYSTERIDALTKTLATMDARARQKYAAQHKDDPAVIAVALNVNNILAAAERNKAMQAGAQQQSKVVDREIAGMAPPPQQMARLPEEQGIAQLKVPNLEGMADGGIAGYADGGMAGGSEFDFAQRSEPVVRMAYGGDIPRYQGVPKAMGGDGSLVSGNPMYNIPGFQAVQPRDTFTQAGSPENMTPWERFSSYMGEKKKQATLLEIAYRIQSGIATPDEIVLYNSAKVAGGDKAAADVKYPPQDAVRAKDFPGVKPGFEKMPVDAAIPPAAGGVKDLIPAPPKLDTSFKPAKAPTTEDAAALGDKFFNSKARINEINRQVLQEQADVNTAKENSIAALEAFNKKQGPAFAGYEQTLKKEELQDATDKEKAGLMALFKGFLGVAAGESPDAAVNFAKGALLGVDDYNVAMKDLKKSAKERNKEMQYIEQARRAEERGNFDKAQMYEDKAETSRQASARFGIAAINDITNAGGKASADIFNTLSSNTSRENIARMQEASQNVRANAQLRAPSAQMQLFGALGKGDIEKGLGIYAETMGPEGKGLQSTLKQYSGMTGELELRRMETAGTPEEKARAATIRQLQKQQLVSGLKPVNVAEALP